jgi:CheY-like chemotaxis protein
VRKILLVEDEPILRETYQMILSTQPYVSDVAENGQEALEKFKKKKYDLVLLDVMMPVMNGVEFLEAIKHDESMLSKVVIMSNLSAGKELDRARELGVEEFLLKSDLSPKQLIAQIRSYLEA